MINKKIFEGLKGYQTTEETLSGVAQSFPMIFGHLLRMMHVMLHPCYVFNFMFERGQFIQFMSNLGNAIQSHNFDYIDNIIIEFLSSYNYVIPPYKVIIDLDPNSVQRFTDLCNNFKGKKWNDILSPLVDGIVDLLENATAAGKKIDLGA